MYFPGISFVISSAIISFSAVLIYNYMYVVKEEKPLRSRVTIFTKKLLGCRRICFVSKIPCGPECAMIKIQILVNEIESAKYSLDACIFLITNYSIGNAIIRAYKRGVKVRVIYDENLAFSTESKIATFIKEGISVKPNNTDLNKNMQHKYCIIDSGTENGKLITGSVNWTLQGFCGNYEYCIITEQKKMIEKYQDMFNVRWQACEKKE